MRSHSSARYLKWRKVAKLIFFIAIVTGLSAYFGRAYAFGFLGLCSLAVIYIHAIYLPSKGINGWTGEPKEKYYELRGWKK